jgi:hypothetical protein
MNSEKDSDNQTKQLLDYLLQDDHCIVHLNTRSEGMVLPEVAKKEISVSLKLSHLFAGIVALRDTHVEAELRFGSFPFQCIIPYKGIWAVTSIIGTHTIWEHRAPNPALPILLKASSADSQESTNALQPQKTDPDPSSEGAKKERPSFLRRVK